MVLNFTPKVLLQRVVNRIAVCDIMLLLSYHSCSTRAAGGALVGTIGYVSFLHDPDSYDMLAVGTVALSPQPHLRICQA